MNGKIEGQEHPIAKVFSSDFEFVMLKLIETLRVLDYYAPGSDLYKKISKDVDTLKEILINVIASNHPESPQSITYNQYASCYEFLKHFQEGRTYTFNYDLILYWVLMRFKDDEGNGFHALFYSFTTEVKDYADVIYQVNEEDLEDIIILG